MVLEIRTAARVLLDRVADLRSGVAREAEDLLRQWQPLIRREDTGTNAANLACYIALRRRDLRGLQRDLAPFGLSTLGRLEGRVLPNLDAVAQALRALSGCPPDPFALIDTDQWHAGERHLEAATDQLFGPAPGHRRSRLMVTLPGDAAENPAFLRACIRNGMNVARINCAHDDLAAWDDMVRQVRRLAAAEDRQVRILMDIAGPKSRIEEVRIAPQFERVRTGDRILLVQDQFRPLKQEPVQIRVGIPEVVPALGVGDEVWFDDGKLGCVVESRDGDAAALKVLRAREKGVKLKVGKGLNLPHTDIHVPALTAKDIADLDFIAHRADIIGYSFVQCRDDIERLQAELARHRPDDWEKIGIIAKIETSQAVRNLPGIIVSAAGRQPFGVMVARGDLAVELGFERLAEMQEELLWICEAARVPVIWATQVLDEFVRTGLPSRGEMTDAAMAGRAECVMLNKGPNTTEALQILDRLLGRMAEHQIKKTPQLRALHSW